MRPVTVDEHTIPIQFIECIAPNMFPLVDQKDVMTCRRAAFCNHASGKAGTNDEHIEFH
jgi:hypothetical protein